MERDTKLSIRHYCMVQLIEIITYFESDLVNLFFYIFSQIFFIALYIDFDKINDVYRFQKNKLLNG